MPAIQFADRTVVSVTATESGDWQVVSTPTGFQGITSAEFAANDLFGGFVLFEDGENWEVYDGEADAAFLQISSLTGTVTLSRPANDDIFRSTNNNQRVTAGSGTHTLTLAPGSATWARVWRETNPTWRTFTGADATPSVADYRYFKTSGSTTITAFDDMATGQHFTVMRGDADITFTNSASIVLPGGVDLTLTTESPVAVFAEDGGVAKWIGGADGLVARLASTSNGAGASLVGVEDASSYYSGSDTEAVLAELGPERVGYYATYAAAEAADAPATMTHLRVGDMAYTRLAPATANPALTTNDGALWGPLGQANVRHWGFVHDDESAVSANTTAFQTAVDFCGTYGRSLDLDKGTLHSYPIVAEVTKPFRLFGHGNTAWPKQYGYTGFDKLPSPTQIAIHKDGDRDIEFYGISDMRAAGARWANASARAGYNEDYYELISLMNDDGTIRAINAGIYVKGEGASGMMFEDFRIMPNGGGDEGLDAYNDATGSASVDWAEDMDVGILQNGCEHVKYNNVQRVGHWRIAGYLCIAAQNDTSGYAVGGQPPYFTTHTNCVDQGWTAVSIRGTDSFRIVAITTTTIDILLQDNHPFRTDVSGYANVELSSGYLSSTNFTLSSTAEVNVSGEDRLRLTLGSNPISAGYAIGDYVHPRTVGGGTSHVRFLNCRQQPLVHPSGYLAHDTTLTYAFSAPSKCREVSGWKAVEVEFIDNSVEGYGEVDLHLHSVWSGRDLNCSYERNPARGESGNDQLFRMIAAPWHDANPNVAAGRGAGWTRAYDLDGPSLRFDPDIDVGPNYALADRGHFTSDDGMWRAEVSWIPQRTVYANAESGLIGLAAPIDGKVGFCGSDFTHEDSGSGDPKHKFGYDEAADELFNSIDIVPTVNTTNLGSNTEYYLAANAITWNVPASNSGLMKINNSTQYVWNASVFRPNVDGVPNLGVDSYRFNTVYSSEFDGDSINAATSLAIKIAGTTELIGNDVVFRSNTDDDKDLGNASFRWSEVFSATGTINTSDEREKQDIEPIPDEWLDAWADVEYCRFRWKSAVEKKGDAARWHTGLIAQRVRDAFASHNIDAFEIGLLCYDQWGDEYEDQYEVQEVTHTDEDGNEVTEMKRVKTGTLQTLEAGDRYGLRYEQALVMEAALMRRRIEELEASLGTGIIGT